MKKKKTKKVTSTKKTKKKTKKAAKCKKKLGSIFKTKTVHSVEYRAWETFVNKFYGIKSYNFVANEECGNDSSHSFSPDGVLDEYDQQEVDEFVAEDGSPCYRTSYIFNDLVARGELPAGNYSVTVCW